MDTEINDLTDCPVCFEPFTEPKRLSCDHSLCKRCVDRIKGYNRIRCPKCKRETNTNNITPDFRLAQFLEALTKQAEILTEVHAVEGPKCELCEKCTIALKCEDCELWICTDCNNAHQKMKATRRHIVVPWTDIQETVKSKMKDELAELHPKITEYQIAIGRIQSAITKAKDVETKAMFSSKEMKQICINEVNRMFVVFDTQIAHTAQESIDSYQEQKKKLENELQKILLSKTKLDELMRKNDIETARKGDLLIAEAKESMKTISCPLVDIEDARIELVRNEKWNAEDIASLRAQSGKSTLKEASTSTSAFDVRPKISMTYPKTGPIGTTSNDNRKVGVAVSDGTIDCDVLELYFENKKLSGGGPIANIELLQENAAVVEFESEIDAQTILMRGSYTVRHQTLYVRPYERKREGKIPNGKNTTVIVTGYKPNLTVEALELWMERKINNGGPIRSITEYREMAGVEFVHHEHAENMLKREQATIAGVPVKFIKPAVNPGWKGPHVTQQKFRWDGRSVEVRGLDGSFNTEFLTLVFESKKKSGGGSVSDIQKYGDYAVVTFVNSADAERCLERGTVKVEGHILTIVKPDPERLSAVSNS